MKLNYYEPDYLNNHFDESPRIMSRLAQDPNEDTFCGQKFNFNLPSTAPIELQSIIKLTGFEETENTPHKNEAF